MEATIHAPVYLNEDQYFAAIEGAVSRAQSNSSKRATFIGSSLGGFAAFCAARMTGGVAYLINPCLRPWLSLKGRDGVSESWLLRTRALADSLEDRLAERVTAFINLDDELLAPFDAALAEAGITDICEFPVGGHRAANFTGDFVPAICARFKATNALETRRNQNTDSLPSAATAGGKNGN